MSSPTCRCCEWNHEEEGTTPPASRVITHEKTCPNEKTAEAE